ncbi:MAG TPA: tRNA (adenosine(37)-N6)-threonylcarbamoyltransferase complex dimerization subunit type 1 TsaB [Planctomycetota bacterium]
MAVAAGTACLALELAGPESSVAVRTGAGTVHERVFGGERGRSLLLEIDALLTGAGVAREDLGAVLCGLGPGSYTGLRIACAAAEVLAWTGSVPVFGYPSFEAAALAAPPGEDVHVVLDAYRKEVYHAVYRCGPAGAEAAVRDVEVRVAPRILGRDAARGAVPENALRIGDPELLGHATRSVADTLQARASQLLQLARVRGMRGGVSPPRPLYLRAAAVRRARADA